MEKKKRISNKQLMLVLPVIVVAVLGLGFYFYKSWSEKQQVPVKAGINTALPDAQFLREEPLDKMAYYEKAGKDSVDASDQELEKAALALQPGHDRQTAEIDAKLAAIHQQINAPYVAPKTGSGTAGSGSVRRSGGSEMSADVKRLEMLMKGMQGSGGEDDPEMRQLGQMMDKLVAVQNPQLAGQIYARGSGAKAVPDSLFKAIPAVVSVSQKARQGTVVELRLLDSVWISGVRIPKGQLLYGLASFANQRIFLEIKNIRIGNQVIPVNVTVYDKRDAMVGLYAPEALLSEALDSGLGDAAGSFGITGFDLGTQLAGAGIDAARSLFQKRVRRVSQKLKAGYPVLIRDNSKVNSVR